MKKISKIIKCIVFFIIGMCIFQILTHIFVPKWVHPFDPASARIKMFYKEKNDTLDGVLVGSSGAGRGYSPISAWKEYGITTYNFGTSYQTTPMAYYKIKEILKYQKPKVIILDMDSIVVNNTTEEATRKIFDNMKLDEVKLEAISDNNINIENKLSYIFPMLRFHSRWNQLEKIDFKKSFTEEYEKVSYKGVPMIIQSKSYIGDIDYMRDKKQVFDIPKNDLIYIKKIINLCNKNNIKLLLIEMPSPNSWSLAKSKAVEQIAYQYNLEFIDFNLLIDKLNIDWKKDTYDKGDHLNIYGAEKVSKYLAKVLYEKYNCRNYKQDESISQIWNAEVNRYEQNKQKLINEKNN